MVSRIIGSGFLVLLLGLAACAPQAAPTPTVAPKATTAAASTPAGATPAAVASPAATPAKAAALKIGQNANLGQFLTDDQGRTLYIFLQDTGSQSTCYDTCAQNWPALLTQGAATAQAGVNASLLGTSQRREGTSQVTYNGHPLYYYSGDRNPGDTNGEGVGGYWYVVSPAGDPIKK